MTNLDEHQTRHQSIAMSSPRFLVTTADERTWKFDQPVLFLGEWCRLYSRKNIWAAMDAQVANPYGLEKETKEHDRLKIQSLSSQLLDELCSSLNAFHQTNHNQRYWNIVLGYWLQRFVSVAINRYYCLQKAFSENNMLGTYIINQPDYCMATANSIDFQWALHDSVWNHHFYSRVMAFWGTEKCISLELDEKLTAFSSNTSRQNERNIKEKVRNILSIFSEKLIRRNDALIINSYLPIIQSMKLQLSLWQFPVFWRDQKLKNVPVDIKSRRNFKIDVKEYSGFELFIRKMLPDILPTCYLEGYPQLVEQANSVPWPDKPKFIFTSNNFDTDEIFKVWTAQKVEQGHKYYVGQHGNLYGTWIYHGYDIPEFATSDKFISWGWESTTLRASPAFIFKTANQKPRKTVNSGDLLLIERCIYNRLATYDRHVNHGIYQDEQFRFVKSLTETVRKKLTVRLHAPHNLGRLSWSDEQRWRDFDSSLLLDLGSTNSWDLIKKSRLVVHSYDSTGILETLSLNIPTIGFWHDLYDEILPEAKPYYELLKEAGILAESPEDAARHICLHWENLEAWWGSYKVQEARKVFCNKYARTVKHPVWELKKILNNDITD